MRPVLNTCIQAPVPHPALVYGERIRSQVQEITYLIDGPDPSGCIQRIVLPTTFRFIFRHEMQLLLKLGGFDLKEVYGSYDLDPFESASDKLIVVASPA